MTVPSTAGPARRSLRAGSVVLLGVALAACGGGLWVEFGDRPGDGRAPSVAITTAATAVAPGGTLVVVAAAADADGIDGVAFFRRDGGNWVLLGEDRREPYEWAVPVPADGRSVVEVLARATDRSGERADSSVLSVPVRR